MVRGGVVWEGFIICLVTFWSVLGFFWSLSVCKYLSACSACCALPVPDTVLSAPSPTHPPYSPPLLTNLTHPPQSTHSANILLSKVGTAKIADVGFSRVLHKSYLSALSGLGTLAWSAPEVLAGRRCSEKADIYSFGVLLWEIVCGEGPVRGQMRAPRVPEESPPEAVLLMATCCAEDPARRPTAQQLVAILENMHRALQPGSGTPPIV